MKPASKRETVPGTLDFAHSLIHSVTQSLQGAHKNACFPMETRGSLLCLQELATCPYLEPHDFSQLPHVVSSFQVFCPKSSMNFLMLPCMLYALPISSFVSSPQ